MQQDKIVASITSNALKPKLKTPNKLAGINAIITSCIIVRVVIGVLLCGAADTLNNSLKTYTSFSYLY